MNCANSFFGCAGIDFWDPIEFVYGFALGILTHYFGDQWVLPVLFILLTIFLLGIVTALRRLLW